jgi:hypothetical protein
MGGLNCGRQAFNALAETKLDSFLNTFGKSYKAAAGKLWAAARLTQILPLIGQSLTLQGSQAVPLFEEPIQRSGFFSSQCKILKTGRWCR